MLGEFAKGLQAAMAQMREDLKALAEDATRTGASWHLYARSSG